MVEKQELVLCQLCGDEVPAPTIEKVYVVPKEITEQARILRARIIRVCPRCSTELQAWYKAKVDKNIYDVQLKKFRVRLPVELVKEYENAFNRFSKFKNNQKQLV
ncbi:MAG: hypothetical protein GX631_02020 [Dehalococcoidales bacterium]|nr:hypothetical protein [Dehalococcoidales bacterium]